MAIATCHTEGCENNGIPVDVGELEYEMDGQTYTMGCSCGPCGQPITDLGAAEPEPEPEPEPSPHE